MLLAVVVPGKVLWATALAEVNVLIVGAIWIVARPDADNHDRNRSTEQAQLPDYRRISLKINTIDWWRRRESNPRPKMLLARSLHAYSGSCCRSYPATFAPAAQNGQETADASLRS